MTSHTTKSTTITILLTLDVIRINLMRILILAGIRQISLHNDSFTHTAAIADSCAACAPVESGSPLMATKY